MTGLGKKLNNARKKREIICNKMKRGRGLIFGQRWSQSNFEFVTC